MIASLVPFIIIYHFTLIFEVQWPREGCERLGA